MNAETHWNTTTFEGAQLEQLRRWSKLSLRQIITAQEEMQDLANELGNNTTAIGLPPTHSD